MAFNINGWGRVSTSASEPIVGISQYDALNAVLIQNAAYTGCFRQYNYHSATTTIAADVSTITGDTIGQIAVAGYFNPVVADLQIGDVINVYSSFDGTYSTFQVSTVGTIANPNVILFQTSLAYIFGSLTPAQVLAMGAAPVALPSFPALSPGYAYFVSTWSVNMIFGGTAYANGGNPVIEYSGGVAASTPIATAVLANNQNSFGMGIGAYTGVGTTGIAQLGLTMTTANNTNFTAGNSTVFYTVGFQVIQIA